MPLAARSNGTVIAHRTGDGLPGPGDVLDLGITASLFDNAGTPTGSGGARLQVHHTAFARAVDVVASRRYRNPAFPETVIADFANGDQIDTLLRRGPWDVALEVGGSPVSGPTDLILIRFTTTCACAVGDFAGGTFQHLVFRDLGRDLPQDMMQ